MFALDKHGVRVVPTDVVRWGAPTKRNHWGRVLEVAEDVILVKHYGCQVQNEDGCQMKDYYLACKWEVVR